MVVSGCGAVNGFECVAVNVLEAEECALGTDVIYSVLVLDVDDVELDDVVCFADPLELLVLMCELELCAVDVVVVLEPDEVLGLGGDLSAFCISVGFISIITQNFSKVNSSPALSSPSGLD